MKKVQLRARVMLGRQDRHFMMILIPQDIIQRYWVMQLPVTINIPLHQRDSVEETIVIKIFNIVDTNALSINLFVIIISQRRLFMGYPERPRRRIHTVVLRTLSNILPSSTPILFQEMCHIQSRI